MLGRRFNRLTDTLIIRIRAKIARGGNTVNYNEQCRQKKCEYYIDWVFYDIEGQPWFCTSCQLQGQSYDITEIAKDCPHKDRAIIQQRVQPDNGAKAETGEMPF
jgi:hypothetical protein